jgi:hypothetical protein
MKREEIPILPALEEPNGGVKVWCRFCRKWHRHGSVGRKVAHCSDSVSPYMANGYMLVLEKRS